MKKSKSIASKFSHHEIGNLFEMRFQGRKHDTQL